MCVCVYVYVYVYEVEDVYGKTLLDIAKTKDVRYIHMCVCIYKCNVCICIYIYMYVCMYVCIYTYIHTLYAGLIEFIVYM